MTQLLMCYLGHKNQFKNNKNDIFMNGYCSTSRHVLTN